MLIIVKLVWVPIFDSYSPILAKISQRETSSKITILLNCLGSEVKLLWPGCWFK